MNQRIKDTIVVSLRHALKTGTLTREAAFEALGELLLGDVKPSQKSPEPKVAQRTVYRSVGGGCGAREARGGGCGASSARGGGCGS